MDKQDGWSFNGTLKQRFVPVVQYGLWVCKGADLTTLKGYPNVGEVVPGSLGKYAAV